MPRDFNGSSSFLSAGDVTFFDSPTVFSTHIWVWLDATTSADQMLWEKAASGFDGVSVWLDHSGQAANNVFEMYHSGTERIAYDRPNELFGQWVSVGSVVQWGVTDGSKLYINGLESGTATFTTNDMNGTQELFIGKHTGGARWLDGKAAHFSVWDEVLTAAEFLSLADGGDPGTVHATGLIRHWDIAGDTDPEPESIDGTDTFAATNAPKSTNPVISSPVVSSITDTTAVVSFTSDYPGGIGRCYISTSATPPSAADLKSGSGAVATCETYYSVYSFPDQVMVGASVGAFQSVATDGTWFFTSGTGSNHDIKTYNLSWVYQSTISLSGSDAGQVNGMFVVGTKLYATGNNFSSATPKIGVIIEMDINQSTGALTLASSDTLSIANWAEQPFLKGGYWWVASHDYHGLDRYDITTFANGTSFPFPAGTLPGDGGDWQSVIWIGDQVIVNLHNDSAQAPRVDVYNWDGSAFSAAKTDFLPPGNCGQGSFLAADGTTVYWAERVSSDGNVWRTNIQLSPRVGADNAGTVSGLSPGTNYYAHFIQDLTFVTSDPWDSNILTSAQFTTLSAPVTGLLIGS